MIIKIRNRLMRVLLAGMLCGTSFQVQALIGGNFTCNVSGSLVNGYDFAAGEEMKVPFYGTCTATRAFSKGVYPTVEITPISGSDPARLDAFDPYINSYIPQLPLGVFSSDCLGGLCGPISIGKTISYKNYIVGIAPNTPGQRRAQIKFGVTAIDSPIYAEWIHTIIFTYNVRASSCTLNSPSAVNLNFGTINSANLNTASQSTTVFLNCPSSLRADVTLTPSRTMIGTDYGISETSLAGLNMQAFWTDTGYPVWLGSSRVMQLSTGSNSLGFSFRPILEAGKSPSGAFQSQYTLTISYL